MSEPREGSKDRKGRRAAWSVTRAESCVRSERGYRRSGDMLSRPVKRMGRGEEEEHESPSQVDLELEPEPELRGRPHRLHGKGREASRTGDG